jgi:hypothetical protein
MLTTPRKAGPAHEQPDRPLFIVWFFLDSLDPFLLLEQDEGGEKFITKECAA